MVHGPGAGRISFAQHGGDDRLRSLRSLGLREISHCAHLSAAGTHLMKKIKLIKFAGIVSPQLKPYAPAAPLHPTPPSSQGFAQSFPLTELS